MLSLTISSAGYCRRNHRAKASVRSLIFAALFALFAGFTPVALALAPKATGAIAIVAAPWAADGEAARVVAAANGTIVGATHGGNIVIAQSADADFVTQLYRSGALLVLDAAAVTACLTIKRNRTASMRTSP
jgi:hypothetical protein